MHDPLGVLGALAILSLPFVFIWQVVAWQRKKKRDHQEIIALADGHLEKSEREGEAEEATAEWLAIKEHFPFLPTPKVADYSGEKIREAVSESLAAAPSLGVFKGGIPAPLPPEKERVRHLYIVGKTGSGKSTLLEHLILSDLSVGRGVAVIAPEGEFFRNRLLPLLPEARLDDLIYFAPGNAESPITWNPLALEEGEDPARAAEDLFTVFKRTLETDLGPRMQPILQNTFAALVGHPGATFATVGRFLTDPLFRSTVLRSVTDSYVRSFWLETYPRYPQGAETPLLSRLDAILRPAALRRSLLSPVSSFSIRETLARGLVLFVDLSGLSEEARLLLGQLLLSKFQMELMRRESGGGKHSPFYLYADEFQSFAGVSESVWRELLSRGRKYGLGLTLANQYPGQLPAALQAEIFGNVNSLFAFALGAKDADVVRKELLRRGEKGVEPLPREELLELPVGRAWAKVGGGRAIEIRMPVPLRVKSVEAGRKAIQASWKKYGKSAPAAPPSFEPPPVLEEPESFLE